MSPPLPAAKRFTGTPWAASRGPLVSKKTWQIGQSLSASPNPRGASARTGWGKNGYTRSRHDGSTWPGGHFGHRLRGVRIGGNPGCPPTLREEAHAPPLTPNRVAARRTHTRLPQLGISSVGDIPFHRILSLIRALCAICGSKKKRSRSLFRGRLWGHGFRGFHGSGGRERGLPARVRPISKNPCHPCNRWLNPTGHRERQAETGAWEKTGMCPPTSAAKRITRASAGGRNGHPFLGKHEKLAGPFCVPLFCVPYV